MSHILADEIRSTGLRRAALAYDMTAAINRWHFTKNGDELAALVPEQLIMLLIASNSGPDHPLWAFTEARLGRPLPQGTAHGK